MKRTTSSEAARQLVKLTDFYQVYLDFYLGYAIIIAIIGRQSSRHSSCLCVRNEYRRDNIKREA